MPAAPAPIAPAEGDLELAADQAIAACGGDPREAVKALLEVRSKVSTGYARDAYQRPANGRMRQMSEVTYYVALPFVFSDDGVAAGEATECLSANAAVMRAEALSRKPGHAGAVAFSRTGDPSSGDFSDARLIRKFGDVPDDLSTP